MSQDWTEDVYEPGYVADDTLENIENNFAALKSCFSGSAAPTGPVAGMLWFYTTNLALKIRNNANDAWYGLMHGDASQKIWVYRNSAMDGWVVDAAVSDVVLAIKGGSTYPTGGLTAGSWTQPTHIHNVTYAAHLHSITLPEDDWAEGNQGTYGREYSYGGDYRVGERSFDTTSGGGGTEPTTAGSTANTYRPAAAVGTLQYLNV